MKKQQVFKKLDQIQTQAIKAIHKGIKKDKKALIVMATGLGKTETAIKTIKQMKGRHLWIVGRNNLVEQTYERFIEYGVYDIGMLNGASKDFNSSLIISSVQTLSKVNMLKEFNTKDFDTIWIDEAHHAAATGYQKITDYFKPKGLIGLTATPDRPDHKNIYDTFGKAAFEKTFEDAQELGVLAAHKPFTILTDSVINGMQTQTGDYSAAALDRLYTSRSRNSTIVASYKKYGRKNVKKAGMTPKAICFCINVAHAKILAAEFNLGGVKADFICANDSIQPKEDRQRIETEFRTGNSIEVLCSVDLMNEGVDIPGVNIVCMARPTRSAIVYQQQIGRAARIDEGRKKFFVVLDYVDNCRKGFESYTVGNTDPSGIDYIPIIIKSKSRKI